ncbi:MAG: hypothetical protein KC621_34085, partial [Myxococcales bacterium]|nr:hypothetical protein [Myxococcales bacterium]
MVCELPETEVLDRPLSCSSTSQIESPGRIEVDETEFDEIVVVVPLPYFGLSPKKTRTVWRHELRIQVTPADS